MKIIYLLLIFSCFAGHCADCPISFKRTIEGNQTQKLKEVVLSDLLNNIIVFKTFKRMNDPLFLERNQVASNIWRPFDDGVEELSVTFKLSQEKLFHEFVALKETIDGIEKREVCRAEFNQIKQELIETYELTSSTYKDSQPIYQQNIIKMIKAITFRDFTNFLRNFNFDAYQIDEEHYILNKRDEPISSHLEKRGLMLAPAFVSCELLNVSNTFVLSVSPQEREDISFIITQMGTKGYWTLMKKQKQMNQAGDRIRDVPTLQFLGVIFSNPELRGYMNIIHRDRMLWKRLSAGVVEGLASQNAKGLLMPQLDGFAHFVGADYQRLKSLVENRDWMGFLCALL